jgi:uncharacterized protein (TIGR02246 family)
MSPTTNEAGVRHTLDAVYAAWAANDADAFVERYEADATVTMAGAYRANRDQIRDHMAAGFAGPLKGSTVIDEVVGIHYPSDDVAVVVSESGIILAGTDSVAPERMVRATWTLRHRDAGWMVTAYASSPLHPA